MTVLPRRFDRYGLTIQPEKTKLVKFGKPPKKEQDGPKTCPERSRRNETFDFLGFTHYWAKSRQGYWVIKRKTARKRLRRSIKTLWQWCKENRHLPIEEQYRMICQKLKGHYQYYGIRSNSILSGYRASIPRESRNIKGTEMFRALLAAKRSGNVHLPRPSARQLEVINRVHSRGTRHTARTPPGLRGGELKDTQTNVKVQSLPKASTTW
jgi:hypothetical protein